MEILAVVLGGLGCLAVWLLVESLGAAAATGISDAIISSGDSRAQLVLERFRREHSGAVVFLAKLEGGVGTSGGWRYVVVDSTGISAYRSAERQAWAVPWADVRSITARFGAIRLDDGLGSPRLLVPASVEDEITARSLIPPLIERMLAQNPARASK